jgi:hypothetical protein
VGRYEIVRVRGGRRARRTRNVQPFAPVSRVVRVSEEEAEREAIRFHEEWKADLKALLERGDVTSEDTLHLAATE